MLKLYDINNLAIGGLVNYKELRVDKEINLEDMLTFLYPTLDVKSELMQEECYIATTENKYIIKEINYSDDDWTEYICKIDIEELKGTNIDLFENNQQTCISTVALALTGTDWTIGSCDVTKLRAVKQTNCNVYDVLQSIITAYGCEITFDAINKKVYIYQSVGSNKGVYFTDQLNLKKLDIQSTSYDYCTRLIPIGKDGLDIISPLDGKNYVENYQYSNKIITKYWEDNSYTISADLKEDAIAILASVSKPYQAYKADIVDLTNTSVYSILDYDIGDTITLVSKINGITSELHRIVKLTRYFDEPEKSTIEISNKILNLDQLQVTFQNTSNVVATLTTNYGTVVSSKLETINWNNIGHVNIETADIGVAQITTALIGDAAITTALIGDAQITSAKIALAQIDIAHVSQAFIDDLNATYAFIEDLDAVNAEIDNLVVGTAQIELGCITSALIANEAVGTSQIADGSITDGKIVSLTAGKLVSGTVDTSKVTILGPNGNLRIANSRLQVFDNSEIPKERVSLGDVNGDQTEFGIRIRGVDGVTLLMDENGITHEGITDGAITNVKISADADINGSKLLDNSIAGGKLVIDAITAREIASHTITANEILANTITANEIKANSITADEIDTSTLLVGENILMGPNAIITWGNLSVETQNNLTGTDGTNGIDGINGTQGIQGPIGLTGVASYTHIAYATDAVGGGFSSSVSTNKTYVGMYTDSTVLDSEIYSKYSWSLIKGADGSQGIAGPTGPTGLTPYFHIAYGTDAVGGGFSTTVSIGKTYIGQYTDNTSADSNNYALYSWTLIKGDTGAIGPAGGQGLQGLQGDDGTQGLAGPVGPTGTPSYTHIAYATNSTGSTGFSTTNGSGATYIGMYVDSISTDSNTPGMYTWSLIAGANGAQGIQGVIGATGSDGADGSQGTQGVQGPNGTPAYLHIAYATSSNGASGFDTIVSTNKTYIGQYTDNALADSGNYALYSWSLIKGADGINGTNGTNGTTQDLSNYVTNGTLSSNLINYITTTALTTKFGQDYIITGKIAANQIAAGTITGSTIKTAATNYLNLSQSALIGYNGTNECFRLGFTQNGSYNYPFLTFTGGANTSYVAVTVLGVDSNMQVIASINKISNALTVQGNLTSTGIVTGTSLTTGIGSISGGQLLGSSLSVTGSLTATGTGIAGASNLGGVHVGDSNGIWSNTTVTLWINYETGNGLKVGNGNNAGGYGPITCSTLTATGGKPALVTTESYGETYMWAEESTHITFTDNGTGELDENGECYVMLDDRYLETVSTDDCDYLIQLTGFQGANVEIKDVQSNYFVVIGNPNKKFNWEVKAERKGYERLKYNEALLEG